jgi:serine/threonine protein kinase
VNKQFSEVIQKCLQKKPENRPSVEELILSENFQSKAKSLKIKLPSELNPEKMHRPTTILKKPEESITTTTVPQSARQSTII